MKIALDPVVEAVDGLDADLDRGHDVLAVDLFPDYPAAIAVAAGTRAVAGLRAVLAALADLEPAPAMTVYNALSQGLGAHR